MQNGGSYYMTYTTVTNITLLKSSVLTFVALRVV